MAKSSARSVAIVRMGREGEDPNRCEIRDATLGAREDSSAADESKIWPLYAPRGPRDPSLGRGEGAPSAETPKSGEGRRQEIQTKAETRVMDDAVCCHYCHNNFPHFLIPAAQTAGSERSAYSSGPTICRPSTVILRFVAAVTRAKARIRSHQGRGAALPFSSLFYSAHAQWAAFDSNFLHTPRGQQSSGTTLHTPRGQRRMTLLAHARSKPSRGPAHASYAPRKPP